MFDLALRTCAWVASSRLIVLVAHHETCKQLLRWFSILQQDQHHASSVLWLLSLQGMILLRFDITIAVTVANCNWLQNHSSFGKVTGGEEASLRPLCLAGRVQATRTQMLPS